MKKKTYKIVKTELFKKQEKKLSANVKKELKGVPETICRKKQITDYSCKELDETVHKRWGYCGSQNKFDVRFCDNSWLSSNEIYDIAVEKGCEI